MRRDPLSTYLNDHLAGATAGVELAERVASWYAGRPAEASLRVVADAIAEDRQALIQLQSRLGFPPSSMKAAAGWVSEKVTRLKLRRRVTGDATLTRLMALETLSLGIAGKRALWESLKVSDGSARFGVDLDNLIERADQQRTEVERYRLDTATEAFTPRP